jgi:hypothetical protein
MQPGELIARSLGEDFHATVVVVADPSGDAQDMGLAFDKPAEADTLHTATNEEAASLNGFVGGSHSGNNGEVRSQKSEVEIQISNFRFRNPESEQLRFSF